MRSGIGDFDKKNPFERIRELLSPTIFAMAMTVSGSVHHERVLTRHLIEAKGGGDEREAEVIGDIVISINATYIKGK